MRVESLDKEGFVREVVSAGREEEGVQRVFA